MKYMIFGRNERFLGCLLFGAAAWKAEARDQWIGWSGDVRERNLGLICNNTRFLILDWVKVPHLASHALGACLRRLPRAPDRYRPTPLNKKNRSLQSLGCGMSGPGPIQFDHAICWRT